MEYLRNIVIFCFFLGSQNKNEIPLCLCFFSLTYTKNFEMKMNKKITPQKKTRRPVSSQTAKCEKGK